MKPKTPVKQKRHYGDRRLVSISILLIIVLGSLVYANCIHNPFIWDDTLLIVPNDSIKNWSSIGKLFVENMGAAAEEKYSFYRPLQMVSYTLDYSFWKLRPEGYHLTNIAIHILAALSLFWFIQILFKDTLLSCLASLFFVVHPVHTEAITYISGRSDPLALLFLLLTFILYIKQLHLRNPVFYLLTALTYTAALLSREQSLILPLLILLYHYSFKEKVRFKPFVFLVALAGIYVLMRFSLLRHLISHVSFRSSAFDRLPGFFVAIFTYVRLLILPFDLHMDYGWKLFPLTNPKALAGLFLFIAALIYGWKQRNQRPITFFALFWFFLALLPVSNIYPINAYMAEHWLYLPSVGFFLLLASGIRLVSKNKHVRLLSVVCFVSLLAFYAYLTIRQNILWKDPIAFYARTLKYTPDSTRAMNNLGKAYQDAGRYDEAVLIYKKTIETDPNSKITYFNLASAYKKIGQYKEAIPLYKKSIEINPDSAGAYYNLANIYKELGRNDEAITLYKNAILHNPNYVDAYNNLGIVYSAKGERQEAISCFKKAIEINPGHPIAYANLAVEYYYEGNYDLAIRNCDKAVELGAKPNQEFLRLLGERRKKDSSTRP